MMHSEIVCDHVIAACGEASNESVGKMMEKTSLRETGLLDESIENQSTLTPLITIDFPRLLEIQKYTLHEKFFPLWGKCISCT